MLAALMALALQSHWEITRKPDPISDLTEVHATLRGDNAEITFMCTAGTTPVLIYQPDAFLGGGIGRYELRDFVFRFDGGKPQLESWKYVDNYAASYSTKNAVRFVTSMIQSRSLVVRAERYDRRTIDSTFDLAGTPQAFHEAFEACGIR